MSEADIPLTSSEWPDPTPPDIKQITQQNLESTLSLPRDLQRIKEGGVFHGNLVPPADSGFIAEPVNMVLYNRPGDEPEHHTWRVNSLTTYYKLSSQVVGGSVLNPESNPTRRVFTILTPDGSTDPKTGKKGMRVANVQERYWVSLAMKAIEAHPETINKRNELELKRQRGTGIFRWLRLPGADSSRHVA